MKCPTCNTELEKIFVEVENASNKIETLQCKNCGFNESDPTSLNKVFSELKKKESKKLFS